MKDVIDVLALQRDRRETRRSIDYRIAQGNSQAVHFIFECGIKLGLQPATVATAATFFHRFYREADKSDYDCYLIGAASLCAAGKARDEPVKLRDAVNVAHGALNRGVGPLELGDEYWNMRGALAQGELLVLRMLAFRLESMERSPHRYLLHYLRSLQGWFPVSQWRAVPLARTALSFLQDFHHSPNILDYRAPHIAIASLTLALHVLGVTVPLAAATDDDSVWYSVFAKDLPKEKNWEIMEKIMLVYNREPDAL